MSFTVINYYIELLKKAKLLMEQINDNSNKLKRLIQVFIDKYENEKNIFEKEIERCINFLVEYDKNNCDYENLLNIQKNKFKEFFELASNIYIDKSIYEIKDCNNKMKFILDSIIDFDFMPPNMNILYNSTNKIICSPFENINEENRIEDQLCKSCKASKCFCDLSFKEFGSIFPDEINFILEGFNPDEHEQLKKINADLKKLKYIKDNLIIYHKESNRDIP